MNNQNGRAEVRPAIAVHFDGKRCPAFLVDISSANARVQMLNERPVQKGELISLSIADLPIFLADIRSIDGDVLNVEFRSPLHQTVVQYIGEEVGVATRDVPAHDVNTPTKRATSRPPFPFDR